MKFAFFYSLFYKIIFKINMQVGGNAAQALKRIKKVKIL